MPAPPVPTGRNATLWDLPALTVLTHGSGRCTAILSVAHYGTAEQWRRANTIVDSLRAQGYVFHLEGAPQGSESAPSRAADRLGALMERAGLLSQSGHLDVESADDATFHDTSTSSPAGGMTWWQNLWYGVMAAALTANSWLYGLSLIHI